MELTKLEITADFICARTTLSWRDVLFGLKNELLAPKAVVDLAVSGVATAPEPPLALVELAGLGPGEWSIDLVERLASFEKHTAPERTQRKWLYLTLAWIFANQERYADPLHAVEQVYADFGYPEALVPFVRYMPMTGPDLGSKEANEKRLYDRWRAYLREAATEYGGAADST